MILPFSQSFKAWANWAAVAAQQLELSCHSTPTNARRKPFPWFVVFLNGVQHAKKRGGGGGIFWNFVGGVGLKESNVCWEPTRGKGVNVYSAPQARTDATMAAATTGTGTAKYGA